jgi:hypothetical protein
MLQDFNCVQVRVSGYDGYYRFVLGAGAPACPAYRQAGGRQESKKCDKQLTHIVRVIGWLYFKFVI